MSTGKKIFITGCFLLLTVFSLFIFRNALLDYAIGRVKTSMLNNNLILSIRESGFEGIRNVYVTGLSVTPSGKDTLLYLGRADVKISFSKLFRLRIGFDEIFADSVRINMFQYNDSSTNYESILRRRKNAESGTKKSAAGYNEILGSLLFKVNDLFNENVILQSMQINYRESGNIEQLVIPELLYDKKTIRASVITASNTGVASYILSGTVDATNTRYNFRLIRSSADRASLPFLHKFDNFRLSFDTLDASLVADPDASPIPVNGSLQFKNLIVNHWRISPVDVLFSDLRIDLKMLADKNRITVNNGSQFTLSALPVKIDGFYERLPEKHLAFDVSFNSKAEEFFNSMPPGMFNSLKGFNASGKLTFKLETDLYFNKPEEVKFTSSLKKQNFIIKEFGEEYFPLINNEFQFTAMDGGRPVRTILVGELNPMFTYANDISPYLRMSVLMSEDPSFMTHNGFVEEAFRESIAKNLKEKRFARGGSTISMQLVKNLFLSRNKTISRKLEEAMIVWLIEQNRLVSKERMLEIYLNIIEWGPDVYGIGEASRFYFSKLPRELNLSESIYLASIIPHPKYFKYMFDSSGTLKEQQKGFYTLIGNRLLTRNYISQPEFDQINPAVKLSGMALNLILPADTIPVDSLKREDVFIPSLN